jgi:hypothetical protein
MRIKVRNLEIGRLRSLAFPLSPGPCCVPWASVPWQPAQSFAYIGLASTLGGGFCAGSSDWLDTNTARLINNLIIPLFILYHPSTVEWASRTAGELSRRLLKEALVITAGEFGAHRTQGNGGGLEQKEHPGKMSR